ncbi:hypothetical protein N7449_003957 [Penicillium cf. viridicatum]|uniref:AAA+ ATPase domain-containing protein n=1 Tax=Penicillium cf. viridicatum TaxID=2972119 RepID=A0A9W9MXW3_9EURO|nr:hypothetical protein N7449_003957 [Penicillium cf. viridicatum]
MYSHSNPARPRDELYMTSTISKDLSGKDASQEQPVPASLGGRAPPPLDSTFYIPNPNTKQEHHNNQDYSFKLMLLEQQNVARRNQLAASQGSAYQRPLEPNIPISYSGASVVNNQNMPGPFPTGPVPYQYPQAPVYNTYAPHAPVRQRIPSPQSVDSYDMNPQYSNTGRLDMYTPPSQGSVSVSEANDLKAQIAALRDKVRELEGKPVMPTASKYQILYRIEKDGTYPSDNHSMDDSDDEFSHRPRRPRSHTSPWMGIYTDPPELIHRNMGAPYLRCNDPLTNFELYLALNRDISFVVFRNYKRRAEPQSANTKYGKPEPFSETILPVSEDLKDVIADFLRGNEFRSMNNDYRDTGEVQSPYLFVYHNRGAGESEIRQGLSSEAQRQFDLFMDYVHETCGNEYTAADLLLEKGKIRPEYVQYLFKPNEVLVSNKNKEHIGYVAKDWPCRSIETHGNNPCWWISVQTWDFDGEFYKSRTRLSFETPKSQHATEIPSSPKVDYLSHDSSLPLPNSDSDKEYAITDLDVFPIKYAPDYLVRKLRRRGEIFWTFRTQKYVSYQATEEENFQTMTDDRYIIDMKTYNRLHPVSDGYLTNGPRRKTLDDRVMAREQPPQEPFSMLMPPRVTGFNLRRKKWFDLSVDRISHVEWNKDAFESLAIDSKSRDLIEALVTNHVEPEYSADLIAGKGNGLILLLHGGPGTGKTLTAESVAEIAERPLYRVTCGDVGIKPEEVEKYLESVLHLGKIWNCVVLLDEADVFLEQRGLEDLNRNALVSAFLRVVEYFEGILILTTNRVGTFDEAFKSRIQLALHYPPLGEEQRRSIWQTFIKRLDGFDEEAVDVENLMGSLDVLQKEKLNGRQIRNAITTARQYAKWKREVLTYHHLKDVIEVSARFDDYLENIHRGGLMQV